MKFKGRMLSLNSKDKDGYILISLVKDKKRTTRRVHRLVAESFIPNSENKPQVNHKNGIRNDNKVDNLEWCTNSENHVHAIHTLNRRILRGTEIGSSVMNESLIRECRKKRKEGFTYDDLQEFYGIHRSTIHNALNYGWKHVKDYDEE